MERQLRKHIMTAILAIFFIGTSHFYADHHMKTAELKTSAKCGMCKTTIEKACDMDGIEKASLDIDTKVLTVTYNSDEISLMDIKNAVSKSGYDAGDVKANKMGDKKPANSNKSSCTTKTSCSSKTSCSK